MMLPSAEVRWLIRGEPGKPALDWFGAGEANREDQRTDEYVLFESCHTVGVKERKGKLEIKALVRAPHPVAFALDMARLLDHWLKWSFKLPPSEEFAKELDEVDRLSILKQRWLRKFETVGNGFREVPLTAFPDEGCNAELTKLEVLDIGAAPSIWWTLGFEAFGTRSLLEGYLGKSLEHVVGRRTLAVPLNKTASKSYPVWIDSLRGGM